MTHSEGISEGREGPLSTLWLFCLLATLNLGILAFFNLAVLSDEVLRNVWGGQVSGSLLDSQITRLRQIAGWGYLISPITLAVRIAFVALVLQLVLLLRGSEEEFSVLFQAVALGYFMVILGAFSQAIWLNLLHPSTITPQDFQVVPGSLASLLYSADEAGGALYALFSLLSAYDLGFVAIVALSLPPLSSLGQRGAAVATLITWMIVAALRWSMMVFPAGLGG